MNSHIITRAVRLRDQTPTNMYKNGTLQECSVLHLPSLIFLSSLSEECFSVAKVKTPIIWPAQLPPLSGLLLYLAILSKVKRSDLSLHRSIQSLTLNPSGVWVEMIEQSVPCLQKSLSPSISSSSSHSVTRHPNKDCHEAKTHVIITHICLNLMDKCMIAAKCFMWH